jgi:hypothetical protein
MGPVEAKSAECSEMLDAEGKMRPRLLRLLHHHFSRRRVLHFDPVLRSTRDGFCDVIVNLQPGDVVFRHACQLGFEGHRLEAAGFALCLRPLP